MPLELVDTSQPQPQQGFYLGQNGVPPQENGGPQAQQFVPQVLPRAVPVRSDMGPTNAMPQFPMGFKPGFVPVQPGVPAGVVMRSQTPQTNGQQPVQHPSDAEGMEELERASRDKLERSLEKTKQAAHDLTWGRFYVQAWFWCTFCLVGWLIAGVIWYSLWHEWPVWTALFYLVQATMSIGFGYPNEEDICVRMEERLVHGQDPEMFSTAKWWVGEGNTYPSPKEGGRGGCKASDISKGVTAGFVLYFAAIAAASVGILIAKLSNPPGNWYRRMVKEAKLQDLRRKAEETPGFIDDIYIHMQIAWMKETWIKAVLALLFWIAIGVLFAAFSPQKMTLWTALYFSVTSISTAGLEGLKPLEWVNQDTCTGDCTDISVSPFLFYMDQTHQYQFAFLGLYCLIGVPLFGWSVSAIGAVFADKISTRDSAITLHQAFTPEEFELMRLLGKGKRGEGHEEKAITLFKFVECQLLRMGKVTFDDLVTIKERFMELDLDASGIVELSELSDTGGNMPSQEKIDEVSMNTAIQYVTEKESELWSDYDKKQAILGRSSQQAGKHHKPPLHNNTHMHAQLVHPMVDHNGVVFSQLPWENIMPQEMTQWQPLTSAQVEEAQSYACEYSCGFISTSYAEVVQHEQKCAFAQRYTTVQANNGPTNPYFTDLSSSAPWQPAANGR